MKPSRLAEVYIVIDELEDAVKQAPRKLDNIGNPPKEHNDASRQDNEISKEEVRRLRHELSIARTAATEQADALAFAEETASVRYDAIKKLASETRELKDDIAELEIQVKRARNLLSGHTEQPRKTIKRAPPTPEKKDAKGMKSSGRNDAASSRKKAKTSK